MSEALDRIAEGNPNIGEQLRDWQVARTQNNEDAYDWPEFRGHTQRIGAPDPGEDEPGEFREYDWTKYAPSQASEASAGSSSSSNDINASIGKAEEPKSAGKSLIDFLRNPFGRR